MGRRGIMRKSRRAEECGEYLEEERLDNWERRG
jgi:hypothetical protein